MRPLVLLAACAVLLLAACEFSPNASDSELKPCMGNCPQSCEKDADCPPRCFGAEVEYYTCNAQEAQCFVQDTTTCNPGYACQQGLGCVPAQQASPPAQPSKACDSSFCGNRLCRASCDASEVCYQNRCVAGCFLNSDCGADQVCRFLGSAQEPGTCGAPDGTCKVSDECGSPPPGRSYYCEGGKTCKLGY